MKSPVAIAITVLAAVLPLTSCASSADSPEDDLASGSAIDAGVFCEEFLKQRIPNPADAEFLHTGYKTTPVQNGWIVLGEFDADYRREFRCEVKRMKSDDGWRLKDLSIDGTDVK